jgi:hypothetical protein
MTREPNPNQVPRSNDQIPRKNPAENWHPHWLLGLENWDLLGIGDLGHWDLAGSGTLVIVIWQAVGLWSLVILI